MGKFLNLDDDTPQIGAGLKRKGRVRREDIDTVAVAQAGERHGFTRSTGTTKPQAPRRGRPPLNDSMVYWRIYVSTDLREALNELRDSEGRRLNDLLEDMLKAYKKQS